MTIITLLKQNTFALELQNINVLKLTYSQQRSVKKEHQILSLTQVIIPKSFKR